jgi:hypothetical protein
MSSDLIGTAPPAAASPMEAEPTYDRWRRKLAARRPLLLLVSAIGIALFARALYSLGTVQIAAGLARVGWGFALIVAIAGAREGLRALAWTQTIDGDHPLAFMPAFRARLVGEAFSALLPMGILVGEPAKAMQVRHIVPLPAALTGLAIEFFFYTISLLVLLTAGAFALMLSGGFAEYLRWMYVATPAIGLLAIAGPILLQRSLRPAQWIDARSARPSGSGWQRVRAAASAAANRPWHQLLGVFGLELAFQALAVAEVYVTLYLISPVAPTVASAIVLETVGRLVTMAFKYLPMRVGVDEAGAAWFANLLQLGSHTGVTLAVVRKLRLLFWSAIGLALLGRERSTRWLPV